jgi:hypothetical protein
MTHATKPLSYEDAALELNLAAAAIIAAEDEYADANADAAANEALYRTALAEAFKRYRVGGKGVAESETLARGECAAFARDRDRAAGLVKVMAARLEDRRDDRRSLNRLVEWSAGRDRGNAA